MSNERAFFCYIVLILLGVFIRVSLNAYILLTVPVWCILRKMFFYNVTRCKQELCQEYTKALNVTVKTKVRLRFYMLASSCHRLSCSVDQTSCQKSNVFWLGKTNHPKMIFLSDSELLTWSPIMFSHVVQRCHLVLCALSQPLYFCAGNRVQRLAVMTADRSSVPVYHILPTKQKYRYSVFTDAFN